MKESPQRFLPGVHPEHVGTPSFGLLPDDVHLISELPPPVLTKPQEKKLSRRDLVRNSVLFAIAGGTGALINQATNTTELPVNNTVHYEPMTPEVTRIESEQVNAVHIDQVVETRSKEVPSFAIDGWNLTFSAQELTRFFQQQAATRSRISVDYNLPGSKSIVEQPGDPEIKLTNPPEIIISEHGVISLYSGAYKETDDNGQESYVLPALDLAEPSLVVSSLSSKQPGESISTQPFSLTSESYPDKGNAEDFYNLKVLSGTPIDPSTLIELHSIGKLSKEYGAGIWRILVTEEPMNPVFSVSNVENADNKTILTVPSQLLPDTITRAGLPGVVSIYRDSLNYIFSHHKYRYPNIRSSMQAIEDLYAEDVTANQNRLSYPSYLRSMFVSDSQYAMHIPTIETYNPKLNYELNPGAYDSHPQPCARTVMREFIPLIKYRMPEFMNAYQKQDTFGQERIRSYAARVLEVCDILKAPSTVSPEKLELFPSKQLRNLVNGTV